MVSTTVHLLRHGEVHNPEGVLYGRLPGYRLSDRGQEMAARVAKHLSEQGRDVTTVIASPLQRAQETATSIAQTFGVELGTDDRLIEAQNHFEGLRFGVGDGALRRPAHWKHLWNPFRPSWGEPYVDQVARMRGAVETAREAAEGHDAVLVSHQLPVWLTRCSFEGRRLWHDPRNRRCNLASLTSLRFDDGRFTGLHYSEPVADLYDGAKQLPRRMTRKSAAAALACAVVLSGCTAASSGAGDITDQGYVSGDGSVRTWEVDERQGPIEITGPGFDGQELGTAGWTGDVVVLNTWYAGCPPCRAEAPVFTDLANEYEDDGVHFLGINVEDEAATAQAFERTFDTPYPSIEDRSGRVIADLSGITTLQAVPTTVVLDRDGMVSARILGEADRSTLETVITDALAEEH